MNYELLKIGWKSGEYNNFNNMEDINQIIHCFFVVVLKCVYICHELKHLYNYDYLWLSRG